VVKSPAFRTWIPMRILGLLMVLGLAGAAWAWWSQRPAELHPDDPRHATGEAGIVMLAADWCGYCRRQRSEFEQAGVRYQVLDVDQEEGDRAMRALGARGVPVTVIGQAVVRGYDTDGLDQRLSPLGYDVY